MNQDMKLCPCCNVTKYKVQFHKHSVRGYRSYCKLCDASKLRQHRLKDPTKAQVSALKNKLKYRYNITYEEYLKLQATYNNCCFICKNPEKVLNSRGDLRLLSVDHDHETGEVRGLLCHHCNQGLGYFKDNVGYLNVAADYLNTSRTNMAIMKRAGK